MNVAMDCDMKKDTVRLQDKADTQLSKQRFGLDD